MNINYLIILGILVFLKFKGKNNILYFALALLAIYFLMNNVIEGQSDMGDGTGAGDEDGEDGDEDDEDGDEDGDVGFGHCTNDVLNGLVNAVADACGDTQTPLCEGACKNNFRSLWTRCHGTLNQPDYSADLLALNPGLIACDATQNPHGSCLGDECVCHDGYTGDNCETSPSPCYQNECGPQGTCDAGSGSCVCRDGYTGENCETSPSPCYQNECGPHGTCDAGSGSCVCQDRYSGVNCETPPATGGSLSSRPATGGTVTGTVTGSTDTCSTVQDLQCGSVFMTNSKEISVTCVGDKCDNCCETNWPLIIGIIGICLLAAAGIFAVYRHRNKKVHEDASSKVKKKATVLELQQAVAKAEATMDTNFVSADNHPSKS